MLVVSVINIFVFGGMACIFQDRRYTLGAIVAIYTTALSLIPCINGMPDWPAIDPARQVTVLAIVAAIMTTAPLVDRLINSIPAADGLLKGWFVRTDGTHRNLCQLSGCVIAAALLGRWIAEAGAGLGDGLSSDQFWQFGILIAALVLYFYCLNYRN